MSNTAELDKSIEELVQKQREQQGQLFSQPEGKYSFDTNAEDVEPDVKLSGKNVIITGGYAGIGKETARVLALRGANVYIIGRDVPKCEKAVEELKKETGKQNIYGMECDLASLASVRKFAENFNKLNIPVSLLINNAGVMAAPFGKTVDGFETHMAVNHFGHFLLANLIMPRLIAGAPSRVISLSSSGHNFSDIRWDDINYDKNQVNPYTEFSGYGQSKTANILFAVELTRRYKSQGVISNSLHPGNIQTELWRHMNEDVMKGLQAEPGFKNAVKFSRNGQRKTIAQGAATTIYTALSPDAAEGGKFYDDCHESVNPTAAEYSLNPESAKRLWEISEKLVGLKQ